MAEESAQERGGRGISEVRATHGSPFDLLGLPQVNVYDAVLPSVSRVISQQLAMPSLNLERLLPFSSLALQANQEPYGRIVSALLRSPAFDVNSSMNLLSRPIVDALNIYYRFADSQREYIGGIAGSGYAVVLEGLTNGDWYERLVSSLIPPNLLKYVRQLIKLGRPSNWGPDLDDEQAQAVAADGWPIVWVPRAEIVAKIVTAVSDTARRIVIADHATEILDDCERTLRSLESDDDDLKFLRGLAGDAVTVAQQGLHGPAQATATVVVDTIIERHLELRKQEVRELTSSGIGEVPVRQLRQFLCMCAIARALVQFFVHRGDPEPDGYNRHASIHAASERQYNHVNALLAMMTAVSILRQIDDEEVGRSARASASEVLELGSGG